MRIVPSTSLSLFQLFDAMKPERNRLLELACNTGCFLLALKRGQFGKLRFFACHAIRAIV